MHAQSRCPYASVGQNGVRCCIWEPICTEVCSDAFVERGVVHVFEKLHVIPSWCSIIHIINIISIISIIHIIHIINY